MTGLAGPIVLSDESNLFYAPDFVPDTTRIKHVSASTGVSLSFGKAAWEVHLHRGDQTYSIQTIELHNGERYEIPVFYSLTQKVDFQFEGEADSVFLFGTFNAWNRGALKMNSDGQLFTSSVKMAPNSYPYKFFVWNGGRAVEATDPRSDSVSNGMGGGGGGGGYNSTLVVDYPGEAPVALEPIFTDNRSIELSNIPNDQIVLAYWQNQRLKIDTIGSGTYSVQIPEIDPKCSYAEGRSYLRIFSTRNARLSNDVLIPLESGKIVRSTDQLARSDWHTAIMYFMMVDRFKNGSEANDSIVPNPDIDPKANYHGGDIAGITEVLRSGFFEELGTNTIWLSPIVQNPWDAWGLWNKGGVTSKFSGYHGYWPISNIKPDVRFGSPKDIENLVNTLNQSRNTYGYHNLMGYISGNQDRSRFISLASGDVLLSEDQKLAGWTREIPKPKAEAYARLGLLHALNFAIPGIPVIYYGDEYGMWGANDPDNRKMMKFTGYDSDEAALRADVQALTTARNREMALLYGNAEVEIVEQNVIHITRTYLGERVQIWINPGPYPILCGVSSENILAGRLVEGDEDNVLEPLSFVYVKE